MTVAMTAVDALKVVGQATANFSGTRKDHEIIIEALQVLEALVSAQPVEATLVTE